MKKTVRDVEVKGKKVLLRCDFNVPMQDGKITDDIRITAALPTIEYLIDHGAKVILMSHMGRPKGEANMEYTLKPVAERLEELLGKEVFFTSVPEVVSQQIIDTAAALENGQVMLLEKRPLPQGRNEERAGVCQRTGPAGRTVRQRCLRHRPSRPLLHSRGGRLPAGCIRFSH